MTNEELVYRIQQGEELYADLIEKNQGLFKTIHRQIDKMQILEEDEALSACYECVLHCVARWDKEKGIQFVTYLYPSIARTIQQRIKRELKHRSVKECSLDFQIVAQEGEASQLVDVLMIRDNKNRFKSCFSDRELIKQIAMKHLKNLPHKQRQIAYAYFIKGMGQVELSQHHNMSQSAISRTLTKVKQSAKKELKQHGLDLYDFHRAMNE